jgi:hypothetical protein
MMLHTFTMTSIHHTDALPVSTTSFPISEEGFTTIKMVSDQIISCVVFATLIIATALPRKC